MSHPFCLFVDLSFSSGKYEQPYAEYHFTMDFQIIVQTAQGLRPSLPKGSQKDFIELFKQCVDQDPESRPSAAEAAHETRVHSDTTSSPFSDISIRSGKEKLVQLKVLLNLNHE